MAPRTFNQIRKDGEPAVGDVHVTSASERPGARRRRQPKQDAEVSTFKTYAKVESIDEEHGVVIGWGIVCQKDGADYVDVQSDHIPEASMFKAAVDFAQTARAGNEMHAGPDCGEYVFMFPMTGQIAKALGIETKTTGLLLGYKPPPDVLAKFKSHEYQGFSIEGVRLKDEVVE
jgi:hypothetical protein